MKMPLFGYQHTRLIDVMGTRNGPFRYDGCNTFESPYREVIRSPNGVEIARPAGITGDVWCCFFSNKKGQELIVIQRWQIDGFVMPEAKAICGEFMIYFWFMGVVHALVIISGLILATPTLFFNVKRYLVFARGYSIFNVILLLVCASLNVLWSYTVWGFAYYSVDYVTDFSPFWPITEHLIYYPFGDKTGQIVNGMNIHHVQLIWFLFAFAAWMITIYLYSRVSMVWKKRTLNKASEAIGAPQPQR